MNNRALSWATLLVGGLLGLVATAQPWWHIHSDAGSSDLSGTDSTGGLSQALMVVVLAGILLGLVLRSRGRRVLAVILAISGAAALSVGASHPRPSASKVVSRLREVTLSDRFDLVITAWPWLFAAAGALILLGAVLMLLTAQRWPGRSDRFSRSTDLATGAVLADGDVAAADPAELWKAMDAGVDPTLYPGGGPTGDPDGPATGDPDGPATGDPGVLPESGSDTMGFSDAPRVKRGCSNQRRGPDQRRGPEKRG